MIPPHQQKQVRLQISSVLKAVISQRLIQRADGNGRAAAVEVMIQHAVHPRLHRGQGKDPPHSKRDRGRHVQYGMQTSDQSIFGLFQQELVSYEEALRWASNVDEFKLKVQEISTTSDLSRDQMARTILGGGGPGVTRFGGVAGGSELYNRR